jgi:hypothetical protein
MCPLMACRAVACLIVAHYVIILSIYDEGCLTGILA